jgi:hypothetical protein
MSGAHAPAVAGDAVERFLSRIEDHLVRFAEGHDPLGHLFAIERLARVARAEWWAEQRSLGRERRGP